jgi:hypothetical protein
VGWRRLREYCLAVLSTVTWTQSQQKVARRELRTREIISNISSTISLYEGEWKEQPVVVKEYAVKSHTDKVCCMNEIFLKTD